VKYAIDVSLDGGKSWRPMVHDWSVTRRGDEPRDFWSQSFCWGSRDIADRGASTLLIRFRNSGFVDEDLAGQVLGDFEVPQVGEVSLISFDPHPLLAPHPYIEWFSIRKNHYRIELAPADAWILTGAEAAALDSESGAIRNALGAQVRSTRERAGPDWGV